MAKGRDAGGYDGRANLIPMNRRSKNEVKEIAAKGGRNSGKTRRRQANFRKVLNQILTMKVPDDVMRQQLEALGLEGDMQTALNAAMIREAIDGNVKAAEYVAKYSGQAASTERDDRSQDAEIRGKNATADVREQQAEALRRANAKAEAAEAGNDIDNSAREMAAFFEGFELDFPGEGAGK